MGLGLLCALGLSIPSVLGKESFEQYQAWQVYNAFHQIRPYVLPERCGGNRRRGKSGEASLRMFGGQDAELKLDLKDTPSREVRLSAWAERWTGRALLNFSIVV